MTQSYYSQKFSLLLERQC